MNKQKLIEKYEGASKRLYVFPVVTINEVLEDLKQLDEPKEKVTLPRPVANWISCVRGRNKTLHFALENAPEEVNLWFCEDEKNRQNIFANAWVNGYHIEKEKRYLVKAKGVYLNSCLIFDKGNKNWFFSSIYVLDHQRGHHTRKELEEAGFEEVFNSPLFEVEEVD
ncbi:DUF1642 domain-containing protein [Streptococcus parasanguinis]|uniref:DUF1642 domain-containing protein n=1 Tax=Streptococcus parasanguinis TaxID=1318 RepID=UPI001D07F5EC|nr:DUF1642 domain-containing protein [Streptococcus parasanguinis]MCB6478837.1 DUF1642 domain-containing protein [Streptococcus parasanguinis]MCQ5185687.1 DUF1642 domain-containing protein [Streptococcus parasanguinis]